MSIKNKNCFQEYGPIEYYHDNIIYCYGNKQCYDREWDDYYFKPYFYPYKVVDKTAKIIRIETRLYINEIYYYFENDSGIFNFLDELSNNMPYLEQINCSKYYNYNIDQVLYSNDGVLYRNAGGLRILTVYPENKRGKYYIYDDKTKFPFSNSLKPEQNYCDFSSLINNKYLKLLIIPDSFQPYDSVYESINYKIDYNHSKSLYITRQKHDILLKCNYIPKDKQSQRNYGTYIFKIMEI